MGVDLAHYHGWQGRLHSPWWSCVSLVRVALLQVFRRKGYWVILALALLNFLFFLTVIYLSTQLPPQFQVWMSRDAFLRRIGFQAVPDEGGRNGYIEFMQRQSVVVMILLAFAGSLLVGADFRQGALPFYLSRGIGRAQYILGKILAISALVGTVTVLPALGLFLAYGLFSETWDYWWDNWLLVPGILGYGAVLSLTLSIILVTLAAYLQKMAPIAIVWSSFFVLLRMLARVLARDGDSRYWNLLDPWQDMRYVGMWCFGRWQSPQDAELTPYALTLLLVVCGLMLAALAVRVRAVEVVR